MISIPIFKGQLRGTQWLPTSGGKVLRVLLGTYEREQTGFFERFLRPGQVLFDVGAHVGYYTLMASRLVCPQGKVFAFEPEPRNISFLKRHIQTNHSLNVTIVEAAVGDHVGSAFFEYGTGTGTGHLSPNGKLEVPVLTLDDFIMRHPTPCHALKMDVEGAEMTVLEGAKELLRRFRPLIFLSTHSPELHKRCIEFLKGFNYSFEPILGTDLMMATEVFCRAQAA